MRMEIRDLRKKSVDVKQIYVLKSDQHMLGFMDRRVSHGKNSATSAKAIYRKRTHLLEMECSNHGFFADSMR